MIDMNQLMEAVREEVTALMLDGVHKTASLCASTCAQHVVAARRQMHQRLKGRNGGTTPNSMPTPTNSTGFLGLTPRQHFRALPRVAPAEARGAPATASTMPCPIPIYTPVPGCSLEEAAANDEQNDAHGAFAFASAAQTPANLTPRMTPSTNGVFQDSLDLSPSMAYDTLVDTRDAVQSLEDKTRMASRAMELIEEAIKVATDVADVAGTPTAAGQQCREDLRADAQPAAPEEPVFSTPRGRSALPQGEADPSEEAETAFMQQVQRETHELQERLKQLDDGSNSRPPSRPPSRRGERSSSPQPEKHVRGLSPGGVAVTTHKVAAAATDGDPQESHFSEGLPEKAEHGLAQMLHPEPEKQDEGMAPTQDGQGKASAPAAPTRLAPLPAVAPEAVAAAMATNGTMGTEHVDPALRQRESEHSDSQAVRRERSTASTYSEANSIPAMELTGS